MNSSLKYMPILAGLLVMAGWSGASEAQAQTVLNMAGSSAARHFAGEVPADLCDAAPTPTRYTSSDGNNIVWDCQRGGVPHLIRYAASASANGIKAADPTVPGAIAGIAQLDHAAATCTNGGTQTIGGKTVNIQSNCSLTFTAPVQVHVGLSDVQGSSFGQSGPILPPPAVSQPALASAITPVPTAVVPFALFLGKNVVKVTGGAPSGQVTNLTRTQIEQIFGRQITDWGQIGHGASANGTTLDATAPIVLCLRNAGSGTKAALDQTVLINTTETGLPVAGGVIFGGSTSNVQSCLASNPNAIGYMDADQINSVAAGIYTVAIDGALPPNGTVAGKRDLRCGAYAYWTSVQAYKRVGLVAAVNAVADAWIADAGTAAVITRIPTGAFWEADENMFVTKSSDKGPLNFKPGVHTACQN